MPAILELSPFRSTELSHSGDTLGDDTILYYDYGGDRR